MTMVVSPFRAAQAEVERLSRQVDATIAANKAKPSARGRRDVREALAEYVAAVNRLEALGDGGG